MDLFYLTYRSSKAGWVHGAAWHAFCTALLLAHIIDNSQRYAQLSICIHCIIPSQGDLREVPLTQQGDFWGARLTQKGLSKGDAYKVGVAKGA